MESLIDYFPAVLAREINTATHIKPMINGASGQFLVLESNGSITFVDSYMKDVKSRLYNIPVCWQTSDCKYFITLDAVAITMDGRNPKVIPELKDEDIIQVVTVPDWVKLFLTIKGEVISMFNKKIYRVKLRYPAVQLSTGPNGTSGSILDNQGVIHKMIDEFAAMPGIFHTSVVKRFDNGISFSLEGMCYNYEGDVIDGPELDKAISISRVKEHLFWLKKDGTFSDRTTVLATDIVCFGVFDNTVVTLSKTNVLIRRCLSYKVFVSHHQL